MSIVAPVWETHSANRRSSVYDDIQIIDSVDLLWHTHHRSDAAYVVRGHVVAEVARRWHICVMLADLLHDLEVARTKSKKSDGVAA